MPGFAGSSWYFLRYMDASNEDEFASPESLAYWKDVDLYIGGTEHAVGHLMYSRFWHKFLYDKGLVPTVEPFKKLINQGMIQGVIEFLHLRKEKDNGQNIFVSAEIAKDDNEHEYALIPVHVDFVSNYGNPDSHLTIEGIGQFLQWRSDYAGAKFISAKGEYVDGEEGNQDVKMVTKSEVGKMSKRYFNVVNPDDMVEKYGADCFRMYEMFLGPIEQSKPWDTNGIDGVSKFLRKFWNLFHEGENWNVSEEKADKDEMKILHSTIKKVTEDIEKFSFNTAVSSFMVCVNELRSKKCNKKEVLTPLVKLLAPFAPFVSEELWHQLGGEGSVHHSQYPTYDESYLKEDSKEYPVSINGKKRGTVMIATDASKEEATEIALGLDFVQKWTEGKEIRKVIVVPG